MRAREKICVCAHSKPVNIKLLSELLCLNGQFTQNDVKKPVFGKCHSRHGWLNWISAFS